jgi:hypothetical protein
MVRYLLLPAVWPPMPNFVLAPLMARLCAPSNCSSGVRDVKVPGCVVSSMRMGVKPSCVFCVTFETDGPNRGIVSDPAMSTPQLTSPGPPLSLGPVTLPPPAFSVVIGTALG